VELETRLESAERRASMLADCTDDEVAPCRSDGDDLRCPQTNKSRDDDDDDDDDDDVNGDVNGDDDDVTPLVHNSVKRSVNA